MAVRSLARAPERRGGGGARAFGPEPLMRPPCFRRREPCVFSAERRRSAVIAAHERFGAGFAGGAGFASFRPPHLFAFRPFRNEARAGRSGQAPGLLRFNPEDSPFTHRAGEQPVALYDPVPPHAPPKRRRPASRNDHTRRTWLALAPDALPRDGMQTLCARTPACAGDGVEQQVMSLIGLENESPNPTIDSRIVSTASRRRTPRLRRRIREPSLRRPMCAPGGEGP